MSYFVCGAYKVKRGKILMMFGVLYQQKNFKQREVAINRRKARLKDVPPVLGWGDAVSRLDSAYGVFQVNTKTLWGYIRSFIPFTTAWDSRVKYSDRLTIAYKRLSEVENVVKEAEKQVSQKPIRSQSLNDLPQPKVFKPLFHLGKGKTLSYTASMHDAIRPVCRVN